MGLTGSQPALEYARAGVASGTGLFAPMRSGASRSGYYNPFLAVSINGTRRERNTDLASVVIQDVLLDQPNTAEFQCFGFTPSVGQPVVIGLGSISNTLFAGTITRVKEQHAKLTERTLFTCTATDWSYLLDKLLVTHHWSASSATQIAVELITTYTDAADGFLPIRVQANLATVDDFPCTFETVSGAMTRLANLVGGYWFVDESKVVHFYTGTEAGTVAPIAIDSSNTEFRQLTHETVIDQVRTSVYVEGMQTRLLAAWPPSGAAIARLPVASLEGFDAPASTGYVRIDQTLLLYTAQYAGGQANGGTVTTGAVAAGATSIAVAETSFFSPAATGGGWAQVGQAIFWYAARSASSGAGNLTGIPASGNGSIQAPASSGAEVLPLPMLEISATYVGQLTFDADVDVVLVGSTIDTTAETTMAALEGGSGKHEYIVTDGRLDDKGARVRGTAETTLFSTPLTTLTYLTRDQRVRSGLEVSLSMASAWGLSGTYRIQQVEIRFLPERPWPDRLVTATSQRRDFYDVLRSVQLRQR